MPTINQEDGIREYYEQVKDQYPDIDFVRFRRVCKAPFEFIKSCIRDDSLPRIIIKYLGKLVVFPGKIRRLISDNQRAYDGKFISQEAFEKRDKYLKDYLKEIEDEDNNEEEEEDNS